MAKVAGTPARTTRRFVRSRLWRCIAALGLAGGLMWGAQPAEATTAFCHGYVTSLDAHSGGVVHVRTCIVYWNNPTNYTVRATTTAYLTSAPEHVDAVHIGAKLEQPLGIVRASKGCMVDLPLGSDDVSSCSVTIEGVSDPPSYYSSGRVSIFYDDGFSLTVGRKLCQAGDGPSGDPTGWC